MLPSYDVLFGRHDVYHQTHLDLDPRIPGNKLVLTVHDLIAANWPDEGSLLPGAEALLARAAALITVSAASRDAILGRFRSVEPGKVHVIWNGVDHAAFHAKKDERDAERLRELGVESTFLLYVGGLTRRKNVSTLLKAQRRLRASSNDIPTLVLVGPWSSDLLARQPPEAGVLALGNVPTDVVPALMRHAVAVVVPSREEGFGLPVLEAQACGTVVVCSDIPVFREVGGEAPIFIDTTTPDSLASGLGMALQLPERERAHRVENGLRHVVEFTWRRSAVRHLDVYEAVQGERER